MAGLLAKWVSKKILAERLENKFGQEDPFFEQVPATRLDGTPTGKFKKQRKALPPGLSDHDARVLNKVKRRAYRLDLSLFSCCGMRFGWGSVIGFVPAIGDALDAFMAMMVVKSCSKVEGGLPSTIYTRMLINVVIDFVIGLVPFIGDVADAAFKANTKNAIILENYLRDKGAENLRKANKPVPTLDPSDPHEFDRLQASPPPDYVERPPQTEGRMTAGSSRNGTSHHASQPVAPSQAKLKRDGRSGGGGFFGFGRRDRADDVETGLARDSSRR